MKPISLNNQRGFTFFEVLVAVAIIGTLSAIVVTNLSRLQNSSAVVSEAEEFAALARQAQLWALTGQTRSGVRPAGGWGVHVDECSAGSCTYFIFADTYPGTPNRIYDAGNDDRVQDGVVDATIEVDTVTPDISNALDVVFTSPSGEVYLNGAQVASEGVVTFEHVQSTDTKAVRINQSTGRIHVDN